VREDGELDAGPTGDAVRDLVQRAVSADDDEQRGAFVRGRARELGQVTGRLREARLPGEPARRGLVRELGPVAAGRAVARGGIDEEDDGANRR
jgi:hypothetical protein